MYANSVLIVQAMYFTSKGLSVYYRTSITPLSCTGFHFHRKTYINSLLQSNISSIINVSEKTIKTQDTKPPHTLVLRKRTAYLIFVLYE